MACDAEKGGGKTYGKENLSIQDKDGEGADVGGQIYSLGVGRGRQKIEARQTGIQENQKGSCARAVEAVVSADQEGNRHADEKGIPPAKGRFSGGVQLLLAQHIVGHDGEYGKEHIADQVLAGKERKERTCARTCQRADDAGSGQAEIHISVEPGGRDDGAHGRGKLVSRNRHMGRNAGKKIGGQRYQTASASD